MATLKINGDTSGYVELVAKPVAGATSIRLDKIVVADSSGRVGIGTDTPSSILDVYDPTAAVLEVSAFNNWVGLVAGIENPPQIRWKQGWSLGFGPATHATGADPLNFNGTGYDNKMTISDGGNVGIGTNNPLNKFVVAEANDQHGVEIAPGTVSYIQAYDRATSDYGDLSIDAQSIRFATDNGTERMRIDTSGNVGIGATPSGYLTNGYNLRLDGGAQTYLAFNCDAHTTQVLGGFVIGNDAGAARITQRENQPIIFATNNNTSMTIDEVGRVTTPDQPVVFVSRTSTQAVTTNASAGTILDFTSTQYNIGGHFNISNNKFTAPITGRYEISWSYGTNINGASVYRTFIWKNNNKLAYTQLRVDSNGHTGYVFGSRTAILELSANDYIELRASCDSGTDFYGDNELRIVMTIRLIG